MAKTFVDIALFILMILEFSKVYIPPIWHEVIGIMLLVLVIIHLVLNRNYFKAIFKGRYDLKRILMLSINIAFACSFGLSSIFGILSSQELFTFMNIGSLKIIVWHKILAYISLLCLGLHLGINFNVLVGKFEKIINKKILLLSKLAVIIGGIYSFIVLDFWNHMTGRYGFSVGGGNIFSNIFEYFCLTIGMAIMTNLIYKKIK